MIACPFMLTRPKKIEYLHSIQFRSDPLRKGGERAAKQVWDPNVNCGQNLIFLDPGSRVLIILVLTIQVKDYSS